MDKLTSKVGSIESSLHGSRRSLQRCEEMARASIGVEVVTMRDALLHGDRQIENVTSEVDSFMRLIEYRQASEVDLKPQINWLSGSIAAILGDFETAESKANEAMRQTMNYQNSVNDIGQDIAVQQRELEGASGKGMQLANTAEAQLRESERLMEEAQKSVKQKTIDIKNKTREAASLRSKLPEYQRSLKQKEGSLAEARRKAERKKDKALLGVVGNPSSHTICRNSSRN